MRERGSFARSESAVAAVEFALILPVMLVLLLGVFEMARYMQYSRRTTDAAKNIAQILSQQTKPLSSVRLNIARNSVYLSIPDLMSQKNGDMRPSQKRVSVWAASVAVAKKAPDCKADCYVAKSTWVSTESLRVCGQLKPLATDDFDPAGMPRSFFEAQGSVIVVDVRYNYRPLLSNLVMPADRDIPIIRSAFVEPRNIPVLTSDGGGGDILDCPSSP